MKVITVHGSFTRGHGMDTVISTTLRKIHENHPDIDLSLLCNETEGLCDDGFPKDIPITVTNHSKIFGYHHFAYFWLAKEVKAENDTVIQLHHPMGTWPFMFKQGKKVLTWHGNNNEHWNDPGFGSFPKRVARKLLLDSSTHMFRSLDQIVTISDFLRNELVNRYGISKDKIERIYWGIDSDKFSEGQEDQGYMLFVGRHVNYKNIRTLIELSKELNFPLICAGGGKERENLEKYARELNAPVEFKGVIPLNELVSLYQNCSFYVTASKWEGFGLPPLEANSCGKPSIVPNNTAHVEMTVDQKTGFIYSDLDQLIEYGQVLVRDPNRRQDMGRAARENVVNHFSLENSSAAYVDLYEKLTK
jgi:glycosyltransferase involved in cell wall biosynthesis